VGNEHTYEFIENVLDEIMDMFPSEIIHVGGDEAPRDRWQECLKCQERVLNEGLKDTDELQHYFINRVGAYLQSRGRKMLGWDDEKMEGRLPDNAMVMNWRNEDRAIETANMKHEVVMAPHLYMYLDYSQGIPENEPMNIGGNLPLEMVYSYEPISPEIASENQQYIIGLQGNLWMEFIHSIYKMEYMVFPRLLAVAETGWSDSTKDFENFVLRLSHNLTWLDKEGVNFRIPDVIYRKDTIIDQEKFEVHLTPPVLGADIYYTLNGDDPMQYGLQYKSPVNVLFGDQDSIALRYIVRTRTGRVSGTRELMIKRN
jgi:hexosaminidase